jgi:hypothetical protein
MNPCRCGNYLETQGPCTSAPPVVIKYQKRISEPILDRIDIHIEVPSLQLDRDLGNLSGIADRLSRMALREILIGNFSSPAIWLEEARTFIMTFGINQTKQMF